MESENMFKKNTCNVQQIAVISKIHNMQWLKNNPSLPGHMKPKTNKGIVKGLKEDLKTSQLTTESTMSVPSTSATDNLLLVNSTNIVSATSDNKNNCDIGSKIDETSVLLKSEESTWSVEDNTTHLNQQMLILQELEQDEMISMAIHDSLLTLEREVQLKLEEESKGKEEDTAKCDLTSLKIKDCTSEINQEDIYDDNNNDKLNIISKPDVKISDVQSDVLLNKGADKEDQSNNICLNKGTDTSLNLKNSNEMFAANDDATIPTSSMSKNTNESKEQGKHEVRQLLEKKETPKSITKNATSTTTLYKKNNVILGQGTENKMKYGIKQSLKNLSAEVVKKTPDKKNHESSPSMLNTSKLVRSKSNLQPKKDTVIIKHSPEVTARHTTKNLKESDQNKTTSLNTANKQYKANRMSYIPKREESGSTSKVHNLPKTMHHTVKGIANYSNSPNSGPFTNKSLNTAETLPTHKTILNTSDAVNKYEDINKKTTLTNEATKTFISKEECDKKSDLINKIFVDIINKEISTSSNEVKDNSQSSIMNVTNKHSTNEYVELKQTNTNPFLVDFPNVSTSNNSQTDTMDSKNITDNDLSIKSTQLGNVPSSNIPYFYHILQQNAQQEQIPPQQNFIRYFPDQFIMDCSVNTGLPKFHSNSPYTNGNTMQLNQYANMQTMSNVPAGAQVQNCPSPNVLPPNTGNMNMLEHQMPNILSCNNQNVIRPLPNFCMHPMSQEEQFNVPAYALNPAYFINPVCVCRNDSFQSPNWNLPQNYPIPLQQTPHPNYNSFCNRHVQSNNIVHKNTATARPLKDPTQAQIFQERYIQRNYGKPTFNTGYNIRNPQYDKMYDTKPRSIVNTRGSIDFKKEKLNDELVSDKESNNLPMISPKACMNYGTGFSNDLNTLKPPMKYSGTTNSVSNSHFQYQKNNEYRFNSKERLRSDVAMGRGKSTFTQSNYQARY